jgi:hypothetical protein
MNRKEGYADMELHRQTCNRQNRRYYHKTTFLYDRRKWDEDEDRMILEHSITDSELSAIIQRSVGAIQRRRWYLKKPKNN